MVELRLNGAPLPATLTVGGKYTISTLVNGAVVLPSTWSVTALGSLIASGRGVPVEFTPITSVAHVISVEAVGEFGLYQDVVQTVNISAFTGTAEAGVRWSRLTYGSGDNLRGVISARDSRGALASRIVWTLYRNGSAVYDSEGSKIDFSGTQVGIYRLKGIAYCFDGSQLFFDSTVFVSSSVNARHALPVPDEGGTLIYLGAVFTRNIAGDAGNVSTLPCPLASATEDICLLPGTTHWIFDLDPDMTTVDDEVVVRTQKGNWCLNGLAGGLSGENIGYDYGYMPVAIPAPLDYRIRLTVEMFKVHGVVYRSFNTRVRIKCYRRLPGGVYQYDRCAYSNFPGGAGRRTRRWAVLFTNMDVQTDVFSGLNRLGTGSAAMSYATVNTTSVPLSTLSTSGTPNPVLGYTGLFYTDSNLYAYYEADGQQELAAKAVAAIEQIRPCCISLLTPGGPIISNRIKRVYGKMTVFLTDGTLFNGSVVNVKIYRSDSLQYSTYSLPIAATTYVDEDDTILKVAEIDIDLADYQFDETGIVADFTVDERGAVISPLPASMPTPCPGPEHIYSSVYSRTVLYDGACYVNPAYVPVLDDNAVLVTPIGGCQDPQCGPGALYCYTAIDAPAESILVPQPLGMPAPYLAYGANPARCFGNPVPQALINGIQTSILEFTGTMPVDLWAYTDASLCGAGYRYNDCQASYAPCAAHACSLIVVYPISGSPHATIEYAGRCYVYAGATQDYGALSVVSVNSVNPAAGCRDSACVPFDANGPVIVYNDAQTLLEVPVRFDHLDHGIAYYGAAPQKMDDGLGGLADGFKTVRWSSGEPNALVYVSTGKGSLTFQFGMSGINKQVLVYHAGTLTTYSPGIGGSRQTVSVQLGDTVWLRLASAAGRLPLQYRNLSVLVSWKVVLFLPRLYDTVVVPYTGSTKINALGFCAYTDTGGYSFYDELPFSGSKAGPVNPDTLVTVLSGSAEYQLLSVRAVGDINVARLDLPWYAGQALDGPFTFKFYAAREAFGAHGEMDVWFDLDGVFPAYLKAGSYDSLQLSPTYYRRTSTPLDTTRNAYQVAGGALSWPRAYLAASGQAASIVSSAGVVVYNGETFTSAGKSDPGLSAVIL